MEGFSMRKFGKRILATVVATTMMVGLVGCGGGSGSSSSDSGSSSGAAETSAPAEDTAAEDTAAEDTAAEDTAADDSATDDSANADTGSSSGETIKVGIINNDPNESGYRTANDKDLKAMFCAENGYDASFAYSLKNDEQITAAQKFIQDGVDYLLLSAADTSGWDTVLKDAQDAGIRVILFDRTIDASDSLYEASIVSDMDKEGETAANWLKDQNLSE